MPEISKMKSSKMKIILQAARNSTKCERQKLVSGQKRSINRKVAWSLKMSLMRETRTKMEKR
jgi:hypothetical protein